MGRGRVTRSQGIVLTAVLGLITAVLLVIFLVRLANRPGGKLHGAFGGATFDMGKASTFAPEIGRHGPLLFQDLLGHGRDIYVGHLGTDAGSGWLAVEAHPDHDRSCALAWVPSPAGFRDCSGHAYPPDGTGLVRYAATVDGRGHVIVDLRQIPSLPG